MRDPLLSMLSLGRRAGAVVCGGVACEKVLRSGRALLVIVCRDASDNTRKKFEQKAHYYGVPCREGPAKDELGRAVGKGESAVAVVTDVNFSGKILELLDNS